MTGLSFLERISLQTDFTPGEAKLAAVMERESSQLAFTNLAEISAKAGVGKSTVTRFLRKLGYSSFPDFIRNMRIETMDILESPLNGYGRDKERQTGSGPVNISRHLELVARSMERTIELNNAAQFNEALALMGDLSRPIYILGAATSQSLAMYAYLLLRYIRDRVFLLDADISTLAHRLTGRADNSLLFAISFHRFSRVTKSIMKIFHDAGHAVVFLTDRHANPLMGYADAHLIAPSESGEHTLFSSRAPAMALVEALVASMTPPLEEAVKHRFADMESIFEELGAFDRE